MKKLSSEEILKELIGFNTVNDQEGLVAVDWLAGYLAEHGFGIKKIYSDDREKANLFAYRKGRGRQWLYFSGHLDTVPSGLDWKKDPWKMEINGDKIYGLGACDMKGGIAAFIEAATEVDNADINLGLLFTYDEENDFGGVLDLFKKQKLAPGLVILAEPTDNQPIVALKGMISFIASFKGKAAHSSTPEKGVNAIVSAAEFINELRQESGKILKKKNGYFNPACATNNPAVITGGDAINKIPAECVLRMEYRVVAQEQFSGLRLLVGRLAKKYAAKVTFDFMMAPMLTADKEMIKRLEKISGRRAGGLNYVTEGEIFARHNFIPIILGPGPITAHLADEYVSRRSLKESVEIYKQIILDI